MFRSFCPLLLACTFTPAAARADEPRAKPTALRVATAEEEAEFENRVRPLLARHCFQCHGTKKQEASLRLDSAEAVARGSDGGAVVVPGDPAASRLVAAVRYQGDVRMPPDGKLPPEEIELLVRWIGSGAAWPAHEPDATAAGPRQADAASLWALRPVAEPAPPAVRDAVWPLTAIDRFIMVRLEEKSQPPAPPAEGRTLIRRATLDLTGVPPTPDEVAAFLADNSPAAWTRVVDRLLASPRYGERWGRHWLDVVRYADTAGETADYPVPEAYRYRNYVIHAFNADKPYDEFLREQLAGDLLAADMLSAGPIADAETRRRYAERITATGYLAISRRFGFDPQNYHHLTLADTIDTLGRSVLGLSLGCARCHDHKYDPVSMADYYALYGIFDGARYPFPGSEEQKRPRDFVALAPPAEVVALVAAHQNELNRRHAEVARAEAERKAVEEQVVSLVGLDGDFEGQAAEAAPAAPWTQSGTLVSPAAQSPYANRYPPGSQGVAFANDEPNRYIVRSLAPRTAQDQPRLFLNVDFRNVDSPAGGAGSYRFYLGHGPGQSGAVELFANGESFFVRHGDKHEAIRPLKSGTWYNLQLTVDLAAKTFAGTIAAPGDATRFEDKAFVPTWDGTIDTFFVDGIGHLPGVKPAHQVDNLSVDDAPLAPLAAEGVNATAPPARDPAVVAKLAELKPHLARAAAAQAAAVRERDAWAAQAPRIERAYAMAEGTPHAARIQKRGEPTQPGDEAPRRNLQILGGDPLPDGTKESGRRELADWLTRPGNPLTARVIVNRVWQHHFGRGLVPTASDFGARGQPPSHPELLDYLAARFMADGWSLKSLHRAILLSRVYQLSSHADAGAAAVDPHNELLGRFPRRRLEAEAIRDAILFVSGGLDPTPGEAHPFPPSDTWGFTQHAPFKAVYETNRRSVYLMTQRIARHPFLALFDGADPNSSTDERRPTTTPTQALFMMNDPLVHQEAQRLAARLLSEAGDDGARVELLHQLLFARPATGEEQRHAAAWLARYLGKLPAAPVPAAEHRQAAWAGYCRALLASNEFIFVD